MRIISGSAKGRRLHCPKTNLVRPVADKVKEALFNILGDLDGARVMDLFAGTGSVGLEALSRGATLCLFVEQLSDCLKSLEKNIETCDFKSESRIIRGTLPKILSRIKIGTKPLTHIFLDPPYDKDLVNPCLEGLARYNLVDALTTIIIEHSPREKVTHNGFTIIDERHYGQTYLSFLQLKSSLQTKDEQNDE